MAGSVFEEKCNYKTLENDGSNDYELICEPCLFDGTREEAKGFCKACGEYLCPRCIKEHKKAKMTRQHLIVTDTLPDQPEVVKTMKKMVCCSDHPEMAITAKCLGHGVYICSACLTKAHRGCKIANVSEWKDGHEPKEILDGLAELCAAICSAKASIEENNKNVYFEGSRIKSDISIYIQKLLDSVKTLEKRSLKEVETASASALTELEKDHSECEEIQNAERYDKSLLEAAVKYGDENDVKVLADIVGNKMKSLKEKIKSLNEKSHLTLQFTANSDSIFTDLPLVGKVEVHREEHQNHRCESHIDVSSDALDEEEKISVTADNISSEGCSSQNLVQQSGNPGYHEVVHKIRDTDDTEPCVIYKIIILDDDGYLALLDHNNSKLKVLSPNFSLQASIRFDDNPLDMCLIGHDTVAVIFHIESVVKMYKIENGIITFVSSFFTRLHCLGITAYRKDMVAVLMSDLSYLTDRSDKTCVHQIQIRKAGNGQIIKTYSDFYAIDDTVPNLILRNARRLLFTGPNSLVLMEHRRVIAFTLKPSECEAEEKWFYAASSDHLVNDMRDILYDGQHLYVCADQGGVLQMSSKNGRNRKIAIDLRSPRTVAIDKKKHIMIVGCKEDDFVHVYKYS